MTITIQVPSTDPEHLGHVEMTSYTTHTRCLNWTFQKRRSSQFALTVVSA